ncbi:TIGR02594 family protein [Filomicrobium sp.]|uniref:TIGR02594 family protein n=1 Tax=Filomicrobium sp. TaxID=2024831 RepID=UPI00258CA788|nr:TIGR02594 family protein [Filomicrobium sp.]MCV0370831.1 TIGR02594 family protein [Filomicrobium sp.]
MAASEQPGWLTQAWEEFGQREVSGARHNDRILEFFRELGHDSVRRDEVAWCAVFLGASLERSGVTSTRSLMARSYVEWGVPLAAERFGAVVVLSRGRDTALGHVGFLVGWTETRLWLLGGNQANEVNVTAFNRARLVALRWPKRETGVLSPRSDDFFELSLAHVLEMEGGYTDDPHDPGGPTNKGITLATFAAWRGLKVTSERRDDLITGLRRISESEVTEIYRQRYWRPAGCSSLAPALAFMHFDAAVNHGVGTAIRILQEASGAAVDGEIGAETRGRIAAMPIIDLIRTYAEIRRRRYRSLPHFWRFGRGWLSRVEKTLEGAKTLPPLGQVSASKPNLSIEQRNGDASMSSQQPSSDVTPKWWGESMTVWGALIAAAASVLPAIAPIVGLDITADLVRQVGEEVLQVGQALTALVGTLMAIYGRTQAKRPLMRKAMSLKL